MNETISNGRGETSGENANSNKGVWDSMKDVPFSGDRPKTNIDRLQTLLDRTGFNKLKKDDGQFKEFLKTTGKQDIRRYLDHVNQRLREISSKERGVLKEGKMVVASLISPNKETQMGVLDYEIDALAQMDNLRYRAISAYYIINDLHLYPDGNGRTSRAIFELLDSPDADLSEQQNFLSHDNNKDQLGSSDHGAYKFEESKNIVATKDFNQFAMLGFLEEMSSKNDDTFISDLRDNMEARIKDNGRNIFWIYGGLQNYMPGDFGIPALNKNTGFSSLNDEEKERVCCALRDGLSRVSVSALAMLEFYREKGQQNEFLERTKKKDTNWGYDVWSINIDPDQEEKDFFGHCECEDWNKEDFLHYASLAESIKEQVLKTSVDIFANPNKYKYSDKNIAEVVTNAKEFYNSIKS